LAFTGAQALLISSVTLATNGQGPLAHRLGVLYASAASAGVHRGRGGPRDVSRPLSRNRTTTGATRPRV